MFAFTVSGLQFQPKRLKLVRETHAVFEANASSQEATEFVLLSAQTLTVVLTNYVQPLHSADDRDVRKPKNFLSCSFVIGNEGVCFVCSASRAYGESYYVDLVFSENQMTRTVS